MILAFDTSCYTTSAALLSGDGRLLADKRRVLDVPLGKRGLSQSEALFQHIKNLPVLIESLAAEFELSNLTAIGVSQKPRPAAHSYMPVFLAGENTARSLSAALDIPLLKFSHQEGHMAAAIYAAGFQPRIEQPFLLCHFSGGTSEICGVKKIEPGGYELTLLSHTGDLHAGQFVDRIGVALGLGFPAGKDLEQLAQGAAGAAPVIPTHLTKNGVFSFSGPETALQRLIAKGLEPAMAARAVEETVGRTLRKALNYAIEVSGARSVLLAGGVMSNQYIKTYVSQKLRGVDLHFATPALAKDNAVGIANLAWEKYSSRTVRK